MSDPADGERPFSALPKPEAEAPALPPEEKKRRRGWFDMPDGALGIFLLLLLAAGCGGLIAVYWPWMTGAGPDNSAMAERLGALETRIGQIATGKAPEAAAASFDALQRDISALKDRADADEARLNAVEKSSGSADAVDAGALKAAIDKNSSDIAQLSQQIDKLAQAPQAGAADPQIAGKLGADEKALAALRSDLDAHLKATGEAFDRLGARIGALEQNSAARGPCPDDWTASHPRPASRRWIRASLISKTRTWPDLMQAARLRCWRWPIWCAPAKAKHPSPTNWRRCAPCMPASPEIADLSHYAKAGVPDRADAGRALHENRSIPSLPPSAPRRHTIGRSGCGPISSIWSPCGASGMSPAMTPRRAWRGPNSRSVMAILPRAVQRREGPRCAGQEGRGSAGSRTPKHVLP